MIRREIDIVGEPEVLFPIVSILFIYTGLCQYFPRIPIPTHYEWYSESIGYLYLMGKVSRYSEERVWSL